MERRSTGGSSSGAAVDEAEVDAKVDEFRVMSFFNLPKEERWAIIRDLQKRYQQDIVGASRDALKAEAGARLARLRLKKDEHIRLCAMRCDKYNDFVKVVPCRTVADLEALRARHADDIKACAEALRDQIRVRLHVYKVKAADLPNIGSDNPEVAVARLMAEMRAVVARALPRDPPPPVPYPTRSAHPAPTRAAVAFHMKHLEAISAALVALVEITAEGAFRAPRCRTVSLSRQRRWQRPRPRQRARSGREAQLLRRPLSRARCSRRTASTGRSSPWSGTPTKRRWWCGTTTWRWRRTATSARTKWTLLALRDST